MVTTVLEVCLLGLLVISSVNGISTYKMNDYCGEEIEMGAESIKLKFSLSSADIENCGVSVDGWSLSGQRILVQFLYIDIDCNNHVQLFDGSSRFSRELGPEVCGKIKPASIRTTGSDLYIQFTGNQTFTTNEFTLLINLFRAGPCSAFEFTCDNGWCIDDDLYCDDYDNCGDNSDICYKYWWVWFIAVMVSFLVICLVITVIYWCCCKKTIHGRVINTNNQPVVHFQTGTNTVVTPSASPWFSSPNQYPPLSPQDTYPRQPSPTFPPPAYGAYPQAATR